MATGYYKDALEQLMLRYSIAVKAAEMYYRAGFSVVLQDIYLGEWA